MRVCNVRITSIVHPDTKDTNLYPNFKYEDKKCAGCRRLGLRHLGFNDQRGFVAMLKNGTKVPGMLWHVMKCSWCGTMNIEPDDTYGKPAEPKSSS